MTTEPPPGPPVRWSTPTAATVDTTAVTVARGELGPYVTVPRRHAAPLRVVLTGDVVWLAATDDPPGESIDSLLELALDAEVVELAAALLTLVRTRAAADDLCPTCRAEEDRP